MVAGAFPPQLPRALAELGLLGATLPAHYGGQDASYSAYGSICQALEYVDSGLRSFLSVQSSQVMYPIYRAADV